ncbi:MAG TPA: glycosyltransferase [Bacteroidales bacterium]|nr:glycosyltransferase [Bacteroidales bacterium]
MPAAIVSVINDLTTDQRVDRTCRTLVKAGYDVLLVGRHLKNSRSLAPRQYRTHRMRLLCEKGPLFYAEYNLALFLFLLSHPFDMLVSNDTDTLPANFLASRIKRRPLVHDCHEYFRGMPELNGRPFITRCWKWIEDRLFPRLRRVVAVNGSVAELYRSEYGNAITVIRNVPARKEVQEPAGREEMGIAGTDPIILYQGAVNVDRGLEEAIMALKHLRTPAVMVIAGTGDRYESLQQFVSEQGLEGKVRFLGQVPFQDLHRITLTADLGLSIEKDVSLNYHYCLPNKFLDYIQARVPVLVSPLPEMQSIVEQYRIGEFIDSHEPEKLAARIDDMLSHPERLAAYRDNLETAAAELCWEKEEPKLLALLEGRGS